MLMLFMEPGGAYAWLLAWTLVGMTALEFRPE